MPTWAEIERDYPERLAALKAAMGTVTMAQFGEHLQAVGEKFRASWSFADLRDAGS